MFKFERLEVSQLALKRQRVIYAIVAALPASERFNLADQLRRAATSVGANIAEGSVGESNRKQAHYLSTALGSLVETVGLRRMVQHADIPIPSRLMSEAETISTRLYRKLQAFRSSLQP